VKHVVIIGGGFGGLRAARGLANKTGIQVTLVDRQNYHLFQPLLYQVATAGLEQESIAYPLRAILRRWRNVQFRLAEVTGVDLAGRRVRTTSGDLPYDALVIAAGAATEFFGLESVARRAYDLKDLDDAVRVRNRVLSSFELAAAEPDPARRAELLTFVVVGGGPTGVEFAGALAELVNHVLIRDYPELRREDVRIMLIEGSQHPLPPFGERLGRYAAARLRRMGVEVIAPAQVVGTSHELIQLSDGRELPARTLFWSAGVRAAPLAQTLDMPQDRGGRLIVGPDLTLPGHPEVFAIGDIAHVEQDGKPLPQIAPVAMQQGTYAAQAILAREAGQAAQPFEYHDRGTMAVIGRGAAVARVFGLRFTGFPAWLIWLGLHLYQLIDFKNRLVVLLNWAYSYLFFDHKVRLIVRETESGSLPAIRKARQSR